jgi:hypothetical protein
MQTIHNGRVDFRTWVGVLGTMLAPSWPSSIFKSPMRRSGISPAELRRPRTKVLAFPPAI